MLVVVHRLAEDPVPLVLDLVEDDQQLYSAVNRLGQQLRGSLGRHEVDLDVDSLFLGDLFHVRSLDLGILFG